LTIFQKLVEVHPAVSQFQQNLAWIHDELGGAIARQYRFAEALTAVEPAELLVLITAKDDVRG
jgi:hypothetical protein